jgi:hypothetical protein
MVFRLIVPETASAECSTFWLCASPKGGMTNPREIDACEHTGRAFEGGGTVHHIHGPPDEPLAVEPGAVVVGDGRGCRLRQGYDRVGLATGGRSGATGEDEQA